MRLLVLALAFTLAVAVTASVFAIWPVVADAPWENDVPTVAAPIADNSDALRCQGALDYRAAIAANPPTRSSGGIRRFGEPPLPVVAVTDQDALQDLLDQAEREITRYC